MANISKIAVGGTEYDIAGIGLIATIEETLTASKTYNVGDQFIYNGLLYIVTQTIASGTAITIGQGRGEAGDCAHAQREAWTRGPPAGAVFLQLFSR